MIAESTREMDALMVKVNTIKLGISQMIADLPDNPDITRIGPQVFSISVSKTSISMGWSPETYDFRAQYKALSELVEKARPENVVSVLTRTLDEGRIGTIRLHPQVIGYIRGMIGLEVI